MADRAVLKMAKAAPQDQEILGTTENAVRIQISSAIIAYCLVAIVQHDLQLKRSTYEVLQILSISLMDKTHSLISSKGLISIMSKNSVVPSFRGYLINI